MSIDTNETCIYKISDEISVKDYLKTYKEKWSEEYGVLDCYDEATSEMQSEIKTVCIGLLQDGNFKNCSGDLVILYNGCMTIEHSEDKPCFIDYETYDVNPDNLFLCEGEKTIFIADDWKDAHDKADSYEGPILRFIPKSFSWIEE